MVQPRPDLSAVHLYFGRNTAQNRTFPEKSLTLNPTRSNGGLHYGSALPTDCSCGAGVRACMHWEYDVSLLKKSVDVLVSYK